MPTANITDQSLERGPFQRTSGVSAIVITRVCVTPTFMPEARDKRTASLALGVERVERLLKPFLAALSRVDGTPNNRSDFAHASGPSSHFSSDQKREGQTTWYL
jgi:hypothetical protein